MKPLLTLILLTTCLSLQAQKQGKELLDSLLQQLSRSIDDTNKVKLIGQIVKAETSVSFTDGVTYAQQGLALAEKLDWKRGIAFSHNNVGLLVGDTGNNTLARTHFMLAYELNKSMDAKFDQINNLNNIGRSYQRESNFSKAAAYYFMALATAEKIKSSEQIALVATNITAGFLTQKNYLKARQYAAMAITNGRLSHTPNNVAKGLLLLGTVDMETNDSIAARLHLQQALDIYKQINNRPAIAQMLTNMASLESPNYDKELALLLQAQEIYDETAPASTLSAINLDNIGQTYYQAGTERELATKALNFQRAAVYLKKAKALAQQIGNAEILADVLASLSELEASKGNYKIALEHYKAYTSLNDSLFSQDRKNQIAELEGKHNLSIKDGEIAIARLRLSNQRKTQWGLTAGVALLLIIGALLYRQGRQQKKANSLLVAVNTKLDDANKVKARFLGILSHDLRGPVASLVHFLHLQQNEPGMLSEQQAARHEEDLGRSAEELLSTMETMLMWSKDQMEMFGPNLKLTSTGTLFAQLERHLRYAGKIKLIFSGEQDGVIWTDENYLLVIMQNLTANALRAVHEMREPLIEWNSRITGETAVLSLIDNGPGIPDERLKTLFGDAPVVNEKTGFGLHIVRDLAKAIQCDISVESTPGNGTMFRLSFPLRVNDRRLA